MKVTQALLVVTVLTVSLLACEEADPAPTVSAYAPAVEHALSTIEFSRAPGYPMEVLQERVNVAVDAMYEVANTAETWQEAHTLAQRHVRDAAPGVVRATVEQSMAKLMLVGYLNPNAGDAEAAERALEYSRLLVERGSPEAEAVLESVKAFGAEWEPSERRAVAVGAAEAVEAHVLGGTMCEDCDLELPAEARRALVEAGKTPDVIDLRRLDAARELRAIAG